MIKSITVTNHIGESIILELGFPEKSGFLIQAIEGLGPNKATINTVQLATNDGSFYSSARLPARNITFNLQFYNGVKSIEDIRLLSYKYFPIKKRIKLLIETDSRTCEIYGYVESNEPTIFTKQAGCFISVLCLDPYFYSMDTQITLFSGILPNFEFPFSNESLDSDLLELGQIVTKTSETVYYLGNIDAGIKMTIHFLGAATGITIYNSGTQEIMALDTTRIAEIIGSPLAALDDIIISTVRGNKYIYHLRNGVYTNILNCLDRDADWFHLTTGDNVFTYTADTGLTNLLFKIENQIAYEGV